MIELVTSIVQTLDDCICYFYFVPLRTMTNATGSCALFLEIDPETTGWPTGILAVVVNATAVFMKDDRIRPSRAFRV